MEDKLLITGGAGFIGANLVEYLLEKGGYTLRILDDLSTGRREYLEEIIKTQGASDRVEFIAGDVCDPHHVEEAAQGVDAIVHLAARTSVVESLEQPMEAFRVNALGTLHALEACRKFGIQRFVYASSNAVVGEQAPPIDETKVPAPLSPYGASKLAGEALCSAYYGAFGIRAIALRFANAYGPYSDHKTSVVAEFIRRAKEGKPLIIYGDGNQTRDFIHARDICRAIELALHYNPTNSIDPTNLVFQIATGRETRIIDLAEMVRALAIKSGLNPPEIVFEEARKGEIRRNYADITRARDLLGFKPEIELEEGLQRTWEQSYGDRRA